MGLLGLPDEAVYGGILVSSILSGFLVKMIKAPKSRMVSLFVI